MGPGDGGAGGNGASEGEPPPAADAGNAPAAADAGAGAAPAAEELEVPAVVNSRAALGGAAPLDFALALASLSRCASLALATSNSSNHQ